MFCNVSNSKILFPLYSVDGSKEKARLGWFINDDHVKPNSKIKIVSNTVKSHLFVFCFNHTIYYPAENNFISDLHRLTIKVTRF